LGILANELKAVGMLADFLSAPSVACNLRAKLVYIGVPLIYCPCNMNMSFMGVSGFFIRAQFACHFTPGGFHVLLASFWALLFQLIDTFLYSPHRIPIYPCCSTRWARLFYSGQNAQLLANDG